MVKPGLGPQPPRQGQSAGVLQSPSPGPLRLRIWVLLPQPRRRREWAPAASVSREAAMRPNSKATIYTITTPAPMASH